MLATAFFILATAVLFVCPTKSAILGVIGSLILGVTTGYIHFHPASNDSRTAPFNIIGTVEQIIERYTFAPQQEIIILQNGKRIKLAFDSPAPVLIGDTIMVDNVRPSNKPLIPQAVSPIRRTFPLPKFRAQRIHITLINRPAWHFARDIFEIHKNMLTAIQKQLNPDAFRLFCLMFLGKFEDTGSFVQEDERTFIEKLNSPAFQSRQWFNNWGISHYLARSGLHLVIVVILLQFLLSLVPIGFRAKKLALGCYLGLYSIISWPAVSFTRALLMVALAMGADIIHRPTQILHLIIVASYAVLLWQPANLFYADFQLSFGLTFVLAWANHVHRQRKRLHEWQTIASA